MFDCSSRWFNVHARVEAGLDAFGHDRAVCATAELPYKQADRDCEGGLVEQIDAALVLHPEGLEHLPPCTPRGPRDSPTTLAPFLVLAWSLQDR